MPRSGKRSPNLRMHHNQLEAATDVAMGVIDARFDELDGEVITVAPTQRCNCRNCQAQRRLAVN
jgi:hypothetical protein